MKNLKSVTIQKSLLRWFCVLFMINLLSIGSANSQVESTLSKAWQNTFGNSYLNTWVLVNQSDYSDSISIIEGGMGSLRYTEVEDQCKYLTTKDNIVVVDDMEKVIYKMQNSFDKKTGKALELSTMELDTSEVEIDSTSTGGKYVYTTKYIESDIQIQIDRATMLIDWIKAGEMVTEYNETVKTEQEIKVIQTFTLVAHSNNIDVVGKYLKIENYIKKSGDEYLGQGTYKSYEVLNLVD